MLTCPSSLSSPSRYKRQNSDSIQFASDRARCARESSKFNCMFLKGMSPYNYKDLNEFISFCHEFAAKEQGQTIIMKRT